MNMNYSTLNQARQHGVMLVAKDAHMTVSLYRFKNPENIPTDEQLALSEVNLNDIEIISSITVDLDELRKTNEWEDRSCWAVKKLRNSEESLVLLNRNNLRMPYKLDIVKFNTLYGEDVLLFTVPYKTMKSNNISVHLYRGNNYPIITNTKLTSRNDIYHIYSDFPELSITESVLEVLEDNTISIEVNVSHPTGDPYKHPVDIHFEHVNGYLPVTCVKDVVSKCSVRVSALGMLKGETIRLKAGFKYWSNVIEKVVKVV